MASPSLTPSPTPTSPSSQPLISGGLAGTAVDTLFYPLDTLKTRLQARAGFLASGGFSGVYRGLGSVVVGSAPGAALFFTTYEQLKRVIPQTGISSEPLIHMLSASGGEVAACLIRVPTEVVKQRQQTAAYGEKTGTATALRRVLGETGVRGLYRGFGSTVAREIPFCMIQFPLYERLKLLLSQQLSLPSSSDLAAPQAAICGSIAGAFSAAVTTPLDVAKTRIMLERRTGGTGVQLGIAGTLTGLVREEGWSALFKGIVPRTVWIGLGGAVFLGVYEGAKRELGNCDILRV